MVAGYAGRAVIARPKRCRQIAIDPFAGTGRDRAKI